MHLAQPQQPFDILRALRCQEYPEMPRLLTCIRLRFQDYSEMPRLVTWQYWEVS